VRLPARLTSLQRPRQDSQALTNDDSGDSQPLGSVGASTGEGKLLNRANKEVHTTDISSGFRR